MLHRFALAFALLSMAFLATASPIEPRDPGLITDLLKGILTGVPKNIGDILKRVVSGLSSEISTKPASCSSSDPCCVWYDVSTELTKLFKETNGQCNDNARGAIRMAFHDAASWDKTSAFGGADGSFLMDFGEEKRAENNGLQTIRTALRTVQAKYKVGYADLVQFAHNHATISCPKGPRIRTFVGRKDATQAAPDGLLPGANDTPANLIAIFAAKGFDSDQLVALLGAHTSSKQRFFNTAKAGMALDTTPGVWDVNFYNDTLQNPQSSSVFILPSDKKISTYKDTKDEWASYVGNQKDWNEDYAASWIQMSLNGVTNVASLTECTRTLPKMTLK